MTQAKYQISALFFILAAAVIATVLFMYRSSPGSPGSITWDIRTGTYYVISHTFIFWVLSAYFIACACVYLVFERVSRKTMSVPLGHVHFWLSSAAVATLLYSFYRMEPLLGMNFVGAEATILSLRKLMFVALFGFLAAQIVFVVNVILSFFRTQRFHSTEP